MQEPLLRMTSLYRVAPATSGDTRIDPSNLNRDFGQQVLNSPTVFNFFEPDFVRPGPLAEAGLYAPEFQVLTDTTAITGANVIYNQLFGNLSGVTVDLASWLPLAGNRDQLVARLNLLFASNSLSSTSLAKLSAAYDSFPVETTALVRVRSMIYLTMMAPEVVVQR
jgi:hypothetical protein